MRLEDVVAAFEAAVMHQQDGRSSEAEAVYRNLIAAYPDCAAALNNLALLRPPAEALALFERAVTAEPDYVDALVNLSSALQSDGQTGRAATFYAHALTLIPDTAQGRFNLGYILQTQGRYHDAVRQYELAVGLSPDFAAALSNLGTVHGQLGQPDIAAAYYFRALACDPASPGANLNVMTILEADGRVKEAARCRAMLPRPQRLRIEAAAPPARTVLLLANACVGNIPLDTLLPNSRNTRITWQVEFATDAQAASLPPFDVALNVIGNADVIDTAYARVCAFHDRHDVLNPPAAVARTRRDRLPALLAGVAGCVVPAVLRLEREEIVRGGLEARLQAAGIGCPVLVRPIVGHGGEGVQLVRVAEELATLPAGSADASYFIAYQPYRDADGFHRKYRMIYVDGQPFAYHLAISEHWLVHYFSADMLAAPWKRAEEQRFLENPAAVLGGTAMDAVAEIGRRLGLDYAGIDFGVLPDGRLVVFEANACMLVHLNDSAAEFAYKHVHVPAIVAAFDGMLDRRADAGRRGGVCQTTRPLAEAAS